MAAFSNGWKQKNENDGSKKEYFNLLNNNPHHQNDNNYRGTFNQINLPGSPTPRDVNYRIPLNDAGLKNGNGKISNQFPPNFYNAESLSSLKNFIGYKIGQDVFQKIERSLASSGRNKRSNLGYYEMVPSNTEFPNNLYSLDKNYGRTVPYYHPNAYPNTQEHVHHFNPTSYLESASNFNLDHNQHPGATFSPYIRHNEPRPVHRHMCNTVNFRRRSPEDCQEVEFQPHTTCEYQEGNSPCAPLNSHFANPVMGHHTMPSPQKTCSRSSCANSPHSLETCSFNNQAQCCGRFPMSTNCNFGRDCRCDRFNALAPHPTYETLHDVPIPHQEVSYGNFLHVDHDNEGFQDNNTPPNPVHVNLIQNSNLTKTPAQTDHNVGTKTQTMESSDNCKTSTAKETDTCGCGDNSEKFGEFKGRILCCPNGLTLIVDYLSMPSICN